jgi:methionyl aminopeptidase
VKAGKIAAQALEFGKSSVKEGMLLAELADLIEKKIADLGGNIAFPVNLSLNDLAAHYHPFLNDKTSVKAEDYLKIDVGVHVDGYIGDTAATVRLAGKDDLILCSEKMLANAIAAVRPGLTLGDLGEIIEGTAEKFGFNAVRNLTGHSLDRFDVHAGLTVPNIRNDSRYQLREDEVIAIEPFCTAGEGFVKDSGSPLIFRWIVDRPSRMPETRKILELARGRYERLHSQRDGFRSRCRR